MILFLFTGWTCGVWFSSAYWCHSWVYGWFLHGRWLFTIAFHLIFYDALITSYFTVCSYKVQALFCPLWLWLLKRRNELLIWRKYKSLSMDYGLLKWLLYANARVNFYLFAVWLGAYYMSFSSNSKLMFAVCMWQFTVP